MAIKLRSLFALLRYTWQIRLYIKCTAWWFDICVLCEMVTIVGLLTHPPHHVVISNSYFVVVRMLKIHCLSETQVYKTVLLLTVTIQYIWSSEPIHLQLTSGSPSPPPQPLVTTFLLSVSMSLTFVIVLMLCFCKPIITWPFPWLKSMVKIRPDLWWIFSLNIHSD